MSPLRSSIFTSTACIYSDQDGAHSSKTPTLNDKPEEPRPKKQKLQSTKTNITSTQNSLHSSNKEDEPKLITSTPQTKQKQKTGTKKHIKKTRKYVLSQKQVASLKSAMISLQEFLNVYNSVPNKFRKRGFYTACKTYLHKVSKTKTSIKEKKEMFLSLPQAIKTSFSLFELMFKEESVVLSNIESGKTEICDLQNSINTLLTFFPPSYIQRKMTLFVKYKQGISPQEKRTISACRKNLRQLEKQSKTLLQSNEKTCQATTEDDTNPSSDYQQAKKLTHKYKQNLTPEAKKILDSLSNETIDSNDIVASRQKLMLLKVDRQIIRRAFEAFKNNISISHRPDKDYVLHKINEAVNHTSKIKINRLPFSSKLQNLYDQALAGTLPLQHINEFRELMFKEVSTVPASSSFRTARGALIRHNKDKEEEIKYAFKQAQTQSSTLSNTCKHLQIKIKEGHLDTTQFTSIYDSLPQSDRTGTLSKMSSRYIKSQLKNVTSFKDKIKLLRELPQSLQKSHSIISLIFPDESDIMSSIRNGKLPSRDIQKHLMQLLQIIDIHHFKGLIEQHVAIKKRLTSEEKTYIAKCRKDIKILQQAPQPKIYTHTTDANKSQYQQQEAETAKSNKRPSGTPIRKLRIQKTFKHIPQPSKQMKCFIQAIKKGNLQTKKFTNLYNNIPLQSRKDNIQRMSMAYIQKLSQQQLTFHEKTAIIKDLPKPLQTSTTTIKSFFPNVYTLMLSISNGEMSSDQLMQTCTTLLRVTTAKHAQKLISKYARNKLQMSDLEQQHVSECIEMLLNIRGNTQDQSDNDMKDLPYGKDEEYASTSTYQSNKSLMPTTAKQTKTLVDYETDEQKQVTLMIQSDKQSISPTPEAYNSINSNTHTSKHSPSSWHIYSQPAYYAIPSVSSHPTDSLSQPSTSHYVENSYKTTTPLSLEQISSDELTYILQSIGDEDTEDNLILQQYLIKLSQELQQETDTLEQSISQLTEEASTSQSHQYTETMDTNTDEPILDCELPQVHEDFVDITDMSTSLSYEYSHQLADEVECTMPLEEMTPEEFFDFSSID